MIRYMLIPLDCLLDTRLGVLSNLSKAAAHAVASNPTYWERDYNDWWTLSGGLVSNEAFNEAYAARGGANTAQTINASFETGIAPVLYRMLGDADINRLDGMTEEGNEIGIAINMYPFVFEPAVRLELIAIMQEKYGLDLHIKLVSHAMEDLTVPLLADQYGGMMIYDFPEWFKHHHEVILKSAMSDFNVIYPKLFDADPGELSIDDKKADLHRFRLITQYSMDFSYIDARYFSVVNVNSNSEVDEKVFYTAEQAEA